MSDHNDPVFPCSRLPDDPGSARLLGLYPQRQKGFWMQRLKLLGGAPTGRQWSALAEIARRFTPSVPLHLTTRQDIELHNIPSDDVGAVQQAISGAGLTGLGACGDTLRNLTVCPCNGLGPNSVNLVPLAQQIRRTLEAMDGIYDMPRKFKISLSCSHACGQPWINDLGLVAAQRDGTWGFFVTAAGSLGAKPGTGMKLFDWLAADDVLPLTVAALRMFMAHGDREHRSRARSRHIRERVGDEAFAAMLQDTLVNAKAERDWPQADLPTTSDSLPASAVLTFVNGDVFPQAADALAELASQDNIRVRLANHHRIIVFGPDKQRISDALTALAPLAGSAQDQPSVVACPGTRWCSRALIDTNSIASRLRDELAGKLSPDATVCVSGCPNGCVHSAIADIGLSGAIVTRDGVRSDAYNLFVGGGMGRCDKLASSVGTKLSADEVTAEIDRILGK